MQTPRVGVWVSTRGREASRDAIQARAVAPVNTADTVRDLHIAPRDADPHLLLWPSAGRARETPVSTTTRRRSGAKQRRSSSDEQVAKTDLNGIVSRPFGIYALPCEGERRRGAGALSFPVCAANIRVRGVAIMNYYPFLGGRNSQVGRPVS